MTTVHLANRMHFRTKPVDWSEWQQSGRHFGLLSVACGSSGAGGVGWELSFAAR